MRHIVDYPRRSGDFRQLIVICRGRPFQFPPQHINKLSALIQLPATEITALFGIPVLQRAAKRRLNSAKRRFPADTTACRNHLNEVSPDSDIHHTHRPLHAIRSYTSDMQKEHRSEHPVKAIHFKSRRVANRQQVKRHGFFRQYVVTQTVPPHRYILVTQSTPVTSFCGESVMFPDISGNLPSDAVQYRSAARVHAASGSFVIQRHRSAGVSASG